MLAYKFRTVEKLDFLVDIVFNKRLYCCRSNLLNDIREADVRVGNDRGREHQVIDFGEQVTKRIRELRVCSLCKSFNNHLLWAHYAGGYSGVAVEVEVADRDLAEVIYDNGFIFLSDLMGSGTADDAARNVLAKKYEDWKYEDEVRIITDTEFYSLGNPIRRIIVGSRTSPALVSALYLICSHFGVALDRMVVADWGIYTVGAQPLHL
jgi:hypothetical protein